MPQKESEKEIDELISSLSPIERAIVPFLESKNVSAIASQSKLDESSVKRALEFLANKEIIKLEIKARKQVVLGNNGIIYLKQELPERRLLNVLTEEKILTFKDAKKKAELSEHELAVALGVLKGKSVAEVSKDKITLVAKEPTKKMPEEKFLEELPLEFEKLNSEQKHSLEQLKNRKDIVRVEETKEMIFEATSKGKTLIENSEKIKAVSFVESLTPEMLSEEKWKGKRFRKYDITSKVPSIFGGKRQPYLAFLQEVREELAALGFEEASGPLVELSFFNCDALFMPQNHPARGIHDLYFVKPEYGDISSYTKLVKSVKAVHETGGNTGSEGWKVPFSEKESSRLVLRSQGTAISARILASKPKIPGKYFAIAKCYRPDIIDAGHHTEFNQLEGIIIDKNVNFKNLLGMLKLFAKKITGTDKIKFLPAYFPFTEPSVEGYIWHKKLGWLEVLPAGIFRPELTLPLGIKEPVLAWGIGIDRLYMIRENINDIRQILSSDLDFLRKSKIKI